MTQFIWDTSFVNNYNSSLEEPGFRASIEQNVRSEYNWPEFKVYPGVFISQLDSIHTRNILKEISWDKRALEVGCGTGWNSMVAAQYGASEIVASDISENALDNTQENVDNANLNKIIRVFRSDLFQNIPNGKWDIIIANLPFDNCDYVGENEHNRATRDPEFALNKRFLKEARNLLNPTGKIIFNHSNFSGAGRRLVFEIIKNNYTVTSLDRTVISFGKLYRKFYTLVLEKQLQCSNPLKQPSQFFIWNRRNIDSVSYLRELEDVPQYISLR